MARTAKTVRVVQVSGGATPKPKMIKAQYVLEPKHIQGLRQEAMRRAAESMESGLSGAGAPRPDASVILRGILDTWLAKSAKGR